ncbi:MAG: aminoglycoside phosphotransferase family protein [Sulfuricaulis sp.]|nr:aminoglycoside phosphotransferase family protein [Sulfuricaulis sp.]
MALAQDIAASFDMGGRIQSVRPYGHGLINDTFVAITDTGHRAILQRVNRHVFAHPEHIMENLRVLMDHISHRVSGGQTGARELKLPEIFLSRAGKDFLIDAQSGFWRALGYIENTRTLERITDTRQAEEVGFALGRFHALVHDLDPARLHQTLPGFHDAPNYLARFTQTSAQKTPDSAELKYCFAFVEERRNLAQVLETAKRERKLVIRPIHGDTKIDNFLFDITTGLAVSLIDLDTVQPGLIHFDVGDCLRSCANLAGESPADIGAVRFDLDICRAILQHYLAETRSFLTQLDYEYLYDAIRLIPFELGLRFLTDHLEGNHYFKTDWPGQNLHRARVQFQLVADIEKKSKPVKALIASFAEV